ncbi:hypothetical protein GGI07_003823 [Coemansia sp. Benny D115]|nr:hypothetical protein GGI07_003823 [Coemansia sp. Benny D115]
MLSFAATKKTAAALLIRNLTTSAPLSIPYPYGVAATAQKDKPVAALAFTGSGTAQGATIGWLDTSKAGDAHGSLDAQKIRPQEFTENAEFWPRVQRVIAEHAHEDPELQSQAAFLKDGWMNIMDGRNPPPPGRTGDAEDILGCVLVKAKQIQQGSFQANWAHRPVTRNGLFQLPSFLQQKLTRSLKD